MRVGNVTLAIGMCACLGSCARPYSEAEKAVRYQLKDGDSAKFRNERRCGASDIITGEVNSKNSYGAYAGFEAFYFRGGLVEIGDDSSSTLFKACMEATEAATDEMVNAMSPEDRANWQSMMANVPAIDLNTIDEPDNLDVGAE